VLIQGIRNVERKTGISRHTIRQLSLAPGDHSTSPWQRFCFLLLFSLLFNYEFRYRLKSARFSEFAGQIFNFHDIAMIHSQCQTRNEFFCDNFKVQNRTVCYSRVGIY
jgi:hypothetical protein